MGKKKLLQLRVEDVDRFLTTKEMIHILKTFGAFWEYDCEAAKAGRVGLHAELEAGLHAKTIFFFGKIFNLRNIRLIISNQIAMKINEAKIQRPDYVVDVLNGSAKIGRNIAQMLGSKYTQMVNVDGKIVFLTKIKPGQTILIIGDVCTSGTDFIESVRAINSVQPEANILQYYPVIINRGWLKVISVEGIDFVILPVIERRFHDWNRVFCPLCDLGSKPIQFKDAYNWKKLTISQRIRSYK